ncbi:uncharacterized protein DUF2512 [Orenia metallireducens]|uniref:DUF2512 family protein n=1 Tax=Orenia metallireducens TaxID=1413210 RepID=A0A285HUL5_9FIRM|nr:DUF2512 family protein [Orenia metallireducens]PRX30990.1 uncharacterized protein DUF2512 [Orenia metallireducens]SNY39418.1 Protein of unknown function [Orenia metallireducens]
MNSTTKALIIKFIMTFVFAAISFTFIANNTLGWSLIVAILVTALNYLLGDLLVLPNFGNITASIGDGLMGAFTVYLLDILSRNFATTFYTLSLFAILIVVGEYFFHQYLFDNKKVSP